MLSIIVCGQEAQTKIFQIKMGRVVTVRKAVVAGRVYHVRAAGQGVLWVEIHHPGDCYAS